MAKNVPRTGNDSYQDLKTLLHKQLIAELQKRPESNAELTVPTVENLARQVLESNTEYLPRLDRQKIINELKNDVLGYGPITPLLEDPTVSEVMVNGPHQVYVERQGRLEETGITLRNDEHVMHIIEKIVIPLGRRIDESMPMVDARLPDGSRVNAIIPPLALNGPTLTIRKFSRDRLHIEDLVRLGTLNQEMARLLEVCVKARLNTVVSGGTGSGKTTTLNVLSSFIPQDERIVTIEDAAELQLDQKHIVRLEARPANVEGRGVVSIRDLVRNALRMRPDRIVVGEVRGGEALDMLQAMNTGHDGSLTTGHANSPRDMLARLETMVLMAGMDLPIRAIREQICSAIDLVVHQSRLKDGARKITQVTEVLGMEGDVIVLQDIFLYHQQGVDRNNHVVGKFQATGLRPKCLEKVEAQGLHIRPEVFARTV